jgi:hypothetical protein
MSTLLDDIPKNKHSDFLSELLYYYVDKQGLGGIAKPDLDALVIYLYMKHSGKTTFDAFALGQKFMLKEARVKSLYETGLIKYAGLTEGMAWIDILEKLKSTKFELESVERGQVRFKFENPALYKYFQKRLRVIGGAAQFSSASEMVTISLETFFELLDHVHDSSQTQFATTEMEQIHPLLEPVIQQLGKSLGKHKLKELQGKPGLATKAGKALDVASKMAGIGNFVKAMLALAM